MKRSPMLDVVLVSAFLIGATAMMAVVRGTPERCPQATPSSVEGLFAPCLLASRGDVQPPADIAALYLPPSPVRPGATMIARNPAAHERDVEATGAVTPPKR
jgi:hypothetical protein